MTEIVKHQGTAPAQRGGGALSLASMTPHDAWKFAEALAGSGMLPRQYQNNPASVLWALEYGRAIGLDVITTTQSVHVIQGRATASADLMASLTRRAGHRMRITGDDTRAEVTIFRADDPEFPFTAVWDTAKATRAKLTGKDTWKQFPGAMLRARAISECVRMACPEVLHGSIYTPEEIGANVDADGIPVEAPVQHLRRVQPGEGDPWAAPAPQQPQTAAQGRDYLHEAHQAPDAATVRRVWQEARVDGAVPDYLAQIAAVGKQKAAAEQQPAAAEESGEVLEGEVVEVEQALHSTQAEADAEAAERELRAAAAAVGLDNLDAEFERSYGIPIEQAPASQIREMQRLLTGTAA